MADPAARVLVVDDEESFVDALAVGLEREGFCVEIARDGEEALDRYRAAEPDLVLLDIMLPKISGIDVCRTIRATSSTPIIMVTAKGSETDTVVGLEIGADDYITKPYRLAEVVARMRAVLRRAAPSSGEKLAPTGAGHTGPIETVSVGDVHLDFGRHEVTVRGEEVKLPLKEFELLELLMLNAGRVISRDSLIDSVWGSDYVGDTKTLDVHIKRLRARIEENPSEPTHITTIRGVGYRFEEAKR